MSRLELAVVLLVVSLPNQLVAQKAERHGELGDNESAVVMAQSKNAELVSSFYGDAFAMLTNPLVQQELELTRDQEQQFRSMRYNFAFVLMRIRSDVGKQAWEQPDSPLRKNAISKAQQDQQKKMEEILLPKQLERLKQITLQLKVDSREDRGDVALAAERDQQEQASSKSGHQQRLLLYNLQTRMMQQAWTANDLLQTRYWLEKLRPTEGEDDPRDFSWYYFNRLCRPPRSIEHGDRCESVEFSLDGSYLATVGGGTVKLWNVSDPKVGGVSLKAQHVHKDARVVAFSPDGTMLASGPGHIGGGVKRSVKLWRTEPFELIGEFDGGEDAVFSVDNRMLAVAVGINVVLFDPHKGEDIATLQGHTKAVRSLAFSPDGSRLATGGPDKTARVWDTKDGKLLSTIDQHDFYVEAVAFWKDSLQLLTAERGGPVRLWNPSTQEDAERFQDRTKFNDGDTGLIFSHDGEALALTSKYSGESFVDVWQVASGKKLRTIKKRGSGLEAAFAARAPWFAIASKDENVIELWNTETWELSKTFRFVDADRMWLGDRLSLSPTGDRIALVSGPNVMFFPVAFDSEIESAGGFAFTRNRHELIYLEGSQIKVRQVSSSEPPRKWDAMHDRPLGRVAMTDDGHTRAATVDAVPVAFFWRETDTSPQMLDLVVDPAENARLEQLYKPTVQAISVSPSGRLIAAVGRRVPLQILDTHRQQPTARIEGVEDLSVVAVSDSNTLASVGNRSVNVDLWDTASGNKITTLGEHRSQPFALCFSRDGQYLASADKWSVKIWRVNDQECIDTIELRQSVSNPPAFARVMAFLPDSKSIVVGGTRQVRQVSLETGGIVATFDIAYWEDLLWNLQTSKRTGWSSSDDEVTVVSVSEAGDKVAAQFGDGRIFVWRMSDQMGIAATQLNSQALDMAFTKSGDELVAGTMRFEAFDLSSGIWRYLASPRGAESRLLFTYSPHEHVVATCTAARAGSYREPPRFFADVQLWDVRSGGRLKHIRPKHEVTAIAFAGDSQILGLAGASALNLWSTETGEFLRRLERAYPPFAFSPNGELIAHGASSGRERGISVQAIADGSSKFLLYGHANQIQTLKFSPLASTRNLLAAAGDDRIIKIWDYELGTERATLIGHSGTVYVVEFSPDGKTLGSGGADRKVRIWDLATQTERLSFDVQDEIRNLSFSSDGKSLAVGFVNGGVQLLLGSGN